MSLAKFLEDGNLTDFLKGELIATSPSRSSSTSSSRSSSTSSSRSASASSSRSASPVRDLEAKTKSLIQEATENFESAINEKIKTANTELSNTIEKTTQTTLENVEQQINDKIKGKENETEDLLKKVENKLSSLIQTHTAEIHELYDQEYKNFDRNLKFLKNNTFDELKSYPGTIIRSYFSFTEQGIEKKYNEWKIDMKPEEDLLPGFYNGGSTSKFQIKIQFYKPYYTQERTKLIQDFVTDKGIGIKYNFFYFRFMAEMIILYYGYFHANNFNILKQNGIDDFKSWLIQINPYDFTRDINPTSNPIKDDIIYDVTAKACKFIEFHDQGKNLKPLIDKEIIKIFPRKIEEAATDKFSTTEVEDEPMLPTSAAWSFDFWKSRK